jgi:hypothetical protein
MTIPNGDKDARAAPPRRRAWLALFAGVALLFPGCATSALTQPRTVALTAGHALRVSACDYRTHRGCSPVPAPGSCHFRDGGALPDPVCTPGALYGPAQKSPSTTVCMRGFTKRIRPPESYTEPLKHRIMRAYGLDRARASRYELDHLVALEDGGAPADPANLWPEPHGGPHGSYEKDREENRLRHQECSGSITVARAGRELASNWIAASGATMP